MKDYGFKVKVSDLLRNPGQKDTLEFENKFTSQISNITEKGIKGSVFLQSLNESTVFLEILSLEATIKDICDFCGNEFERQISLNNISTKFVLQDKLLNPDEKIHDEEFEISSKDETIDLEEYIVQLIISESPVTLKCENCNIEDNDEKDEEIEENNESESNTSNTIKWL